MAIKFNEACYFLKYGFLFDADECLGARFKHIIMAVSEIKTFHANFNSCTVQMLCMTMQTLLAKVMDFLPCLAHTSNNEMRHLKQSMACDSESVLKNTLAGLQSRHFTRA